MPSLDSTSSHPPPTAPDATQHAPARLSPHEPRPTSELASAKDLLKASLRQYPDFPSLGVLFEDILPIFRNPTSHETLIRALELHITTNMAEGQRPDIIVGLEARGFLFGPSLALRLGAGFAPARKKGKLPGETVVEGFEKEYGTDFFEVQVGAIEEGQKVLVVDDVIATGGSAKAAGSLVRKLGGVLLGYVFMLELDFLKGRDKLEAPVYTLLSSQEAGSKS